MDQILKFFAGVGWWVGPLVFLFVGACMGFVVGRVSKKTSHPDHKEMEGVIDQVSRDLNNTDKVLDLLWELSNHVLETRTPAEELKSGGSEPPSLMHPLNTMLLNTRNRAKRIALDIERVRPWLQASQKKETTGAIEDEHPAGIPIGRRDPNDPGSSYYGGLIADDSVNKDKASIRPEPRNDLPSSTPFRDPSDLTSASEEFVGLYNHAVTDQLSREQFRERFQPLRIGTLNAVERSQNPGLRAEIRETTDGTLFASNLSGDRYEVVPRLGLTIEAVSYGPGALGEVFSETDEPDPKFFYSRYRVIKPAIFKKYSDDTWEMESPGKLELGAPD